MTRKEFAVLRRLFEKSDPPPILFRYRGATDWTIKEIENSEVHLTKPEDMNDPFEYRAPVSINLAEYKKELEKFLRKNGMNDPDKIDRELSSVNESTLALTREKLHAALDRSGIICCTSTPDSIRMWGYYASSHHGICIGYSRDYPPFAFAMSVIYSDPSTPMEMIEAWRSDVTKFCDHISRRKGNEWAFEKEFRVPVGSLPDGHTRLLPVAPESIAEIRLGAKIRPEFKDRVLRALQKRGINPKIIQMKCDYDRFRLVEEEVWT